MARKEPLYPHIPKSQIKKDKPPLETRDKDWVEEELPFAGATTTKLWWLATIRDKTYQVEVSITPPLSGPIWKIEEMFANSVAKVSVPTK